MIESNEFQRVILQASVAISNWLKRNSSDSVSTMSAAEPVSSSLKNSSNSVSATLPKLTLQKFSGDPLCFRSFWDSFERANDKNSSLDEISKFNYLRVGRILGTSCSNSEKVINENVIQKQRKL